MKHWNTDPHWKPAKHATWWGSDSMKHPPKPNLPRRFLVNKIAEGLHLGSIYVLLCDLCFCELSDLVFFFVFCTLNMFCVLCSSFFFVFFRSFGNVPRASKADTVNEPTPSSRQATSPWNLARSKALSACSWFTTLGKHRGNLTISTQHMFFTLSILYVFDVKYQSYKDQLSYMFLYTTYYEYKMYQIIWVRSIYIYIRKYISHIISSQSCRFVRFLGVLNCFTEVCRPSSSIRIRDIGAEAIQDIYGDTNIQECKVVQNDSELSDYHIFFARCSASSSVCSKCSTWCSKRILKEMRNIQLKFNWVF